MNNNYEIIYVYDGLCSWCYGFDSVMEKFYDHYKDEFSFKIVSGGMFIGNSIVPAQSLFKIDYRDSYNRVTELSGAKISEDYLTGLIEDENFDLNSEKTAFALSAFKTYPISKENEFKFIKKLQSLIFFNGLNPNKDEFYTNLSQDFNIDGQEFLNKMRDPDVIKDAFNDFQYTTELQVKSYPQVLLKVDAYNYYLLGKGYTELKILEKRLTNILNEIKDKHK